MHPRSYPYAAADPGFGEGRFVDGWGMGRKWEGMSGKGRAGRREEGMEGDPEGWFTSHVRNPEKSIRGNVRILGSLESAYIYIYSV